jgi:hypothetical protein
VCGRTLSTPPYSGATILDASTQHVGWLRRCHRLPADRPDNPVDPQPAVAHQTTLRKNAATLPYRVAEYAVCAFVSGRIQLEARNTNRRGAIGLAMHAFRLGAPAENAGTRPLAPAENAATLPYRVAEYAVCAFVSGTRHYRACTGAGLGLRTLVIASEGGG